MASDNRTRQDTIEESAAASESPGERGAVVDSLAGGAIHELNNILGVILGNVELASMDSTLSESVRTSLDEIGKAGRDGLRLMREILALSRRKPLSSDLADWKPVVDDIARLLRASLPEGVSLVMSLTAEEADSAATPAPAASGNATTPSPGPTQSAGVPASILYLDDEQAMVGLASRMLGSLGFRVAGFVQPEKALAALKADPFAFDLLVTDYNMPRISGFAVARQAADIRPDLPVIVTSGLVTEEMLEKAAEAGVHRLIAKPDSMNDLCAEIEAALRARRR